MARRIIGLDLGAYSVKLLRMETGKQSSEFEIIDTQEEILAPEQEEGPSLLERQKEALLKFQALGLLDAESYSCGIPASDGQIRSLEVPFVEPRKIEAILPGLLESEVAFDASEMIIPWHKQDVSSNEKGEAQENARIRLGFGKKSSIAANLQMLQSANIDPRQLHLSMVAPFEIVRHIGFESFLGQPLDQAVHACGAIIDFGHRATNVCIFDKNGLVAAHSFYRGGKKLTEEIAKRLEISFSEAESLKHEKLSFHNAQDELSRHLQVIALEHYRELQKDIIRIFISNQSSGSGIVKTVAYVGGATRTSGFEGVLKGLQNTGCQLRDLSSLLPKEMNASVMSLAYSYVLGLLNISLKDSRFNFRKDEFVWRGELDFLRTKSVPLVLWGLTIICSLTIMWSALSLVLEKENKGLEDQLKTTCGVILGKPNIPSKKCLAMMKEQIASHVDMGIPEYTASDVYLKLAEVLPSSLKIVINELDILEKRVRIAALSPNYEDIDKITTILRKVPCFIKLETGRTEKTDKGVKYNLSFDLDCSVSTPNKAG